MVRGTKGGLFVDFGYLALLAMVGSFAISVGATAGSTSAADHEAAIRSVLDNQAKAWNQGDLEGFMDGYLEGSELVFTSGAQVRRGWQTTYDKYKQRYGTSPETMGNLRFSDLEVHLLGPDAAWVLGRWDLDGPEGEAGGVFTLVMQHIEDRWVVVHDHTSSDRSD